MLEKIEKKNWRRCLAQGWRLEVRFERVPFADWHSNFIQGLSFGLEREKFGDEKAILHFQVIVSIQQRHSSIGIGTNLACSRPWITSTCLPALSSQLDPVTVWSKLCPWNIECSQWGKFYCLLEWTTHPDYFTFTPRLKSVNLWNKPPHNCGGGWQKSLKGISFVFILTGESENLPQKGQSRAGYPAFPPGDARQPYFRTHGQTYRIKVGDPVTMTCKVENLGNAIQMYFHLGNILI